MKTPEIGLKLWSTNTDIYLEETIRLFDEKVIDYVELYCVPGSMDSINYWRNAPFPLIIHAAHSMHKFNLSDVKSKKFNENIFRESVAYFNELGAQRIIVHPGVFGKIGETITQLGALIQKFDLNCDDVVVENKPMVTLADEPCVGSTPSELVELTKALGVDIVLDVTHAIKYAIGAQQSWQKVVAQFMELQPKMLHVCDAHLNSRFDEHMHIGTGDFDFDEIFSICTAPQISIETNKDSTESLNDFEVDVRLIKGYL
ncbi:MAG: sugar phosphate isomerase/epimerase [Fibrobacterales bacterium]